MQWLFLVHQVRTRKSRVRVKIWRLVKQVGAVLYRNSVYVLPFHRERLEDFQWLCQQIRDAGGEASIFTTESSGVAEDRFLVSLFRRARGEEYAALIGAADALRSRIDRPNPRALSAHQWNRIGREANALAAALEGIKKLDFFGSPHRARAEKAVKMIRRRLSPPAAEPEPAERLRIHSRGEFRNRTWATRERIHIDRLCSAWLIRRFIDPGAQFLFAPESRIPRSAIPFDVMGAEFGHHGDNCTFESLLRAFRLRARALERIARIVHDVDLKDGKFKPPEAPGIDLIVRSLAETLRDDRNVLAAGTILLDALYGKFAAESRKHHGTVA